MTIIEDPEGIEIAVIQKMANFDGKRVFEIGCGDGRLTWEYVEKASHVTAIDPIAEDILTAQQDTPDHLKDRVSFIESSIEDFTLPKGSMKFDLIFFSWSL